MTAAIQKQIEDALAATNVTVVEKNKKRFYQKDTQTLGVRDLNNIILKDYNFIEADLKDFLITTTNFTIAAKQIISPFDAVKQAIDNINYIYDDVSTQWVDNYNNIVNLDRVAMDAWNYIATHFPQQRLSKNTIMQSLLHFSAQLGTQRLEERKKQIAYDPNVKSEINELLTIICGEDYDPMYKLVLESKIWSIKRSMFNLDRWNPFLLCFYGKENTGKGVITKALFEQVIPKNLFGEIDQINDIVDDNRFKRMLSDNVCVSIPELAGGKSTAHEALKSILDREYVDQRQMGTTDFSKLKCRGDMVCSSNERLSQVFRADFCVRKWAEIELKSRTHDTLMSEVTIPLLGDELQCIPPKINILSIWQAINENGRNPLYDKYIDYQTWTTKKCLYWSKTNTFIRDDFYIYNKDSTVEPTKKLTLEGLRSELHSESHEFDFIEYKDGKKLLNATKYYERYVAHCGTDDKKEIMNRKKFYDRLTTLFGFTKYPYTNINHNLLLVIPSDLPEYVRDGGNV